MPTTKRKLTRAKATAAADALTTLLDGTEQDPRLSDSERAQLIIIKDHLWRLAERLRRIELTND